MLSNIFIYEIESNGIKTHHSKIYIGDPQMSQYLNVSLSMYI